MRHTLLMSALIIGIFILTFNQTATAQSALDGFDPNADGQVNAIVVQPDGKILIGGNFTTVLGVTRNRIARLNPDGTLDTTFNPNASLDVYSIALQSDGKILVGGVFNGANSIGGQTRNRIARLDPITGLADSWNPNAQSFVNSIVVQTDGKILVGGAFFGANSIGGQTRNRIARLDATTGLADSFDPNANNQVTSLAVQSDGKVLAGGIFSNISGQTRFNIARLDASSGLADSWNPNSGGSVSSIAVQSDGKILVGGGFTGIGGQTRLFIARLDASTGLADSFNPNANNPVNSIAVQSDGKILAGGLFTTIGGQTRNRIARLDAVSGLADSFNPNSNNTVLSITVQPDGKVLVGGIFNGANSIGGQMRNRIARLERDGRLDQTLNLNALGTYVSAIAVQPDGKILIGGLFSSVLGQTRNRIARLNADGTLDTSFNPNADNFVLSIAVQSDGKILVGGNFNLIGGQTRIFIARLDAVTGAADSWNPTANGNVNALTVQPDGKIIASGAFTNIGGATRNRIARLDAATGLADSWNPNANNGVLTIAVQSDGKVLAGGQFDNIGGQFRSRIARLDGTTGLADSFDPNANSDVQTIAVQSDGKILVGGAFNGANSIGGQTRNRIARLDASSGAADSWNPTADNEVRSITVQSDGKVLAGGFFIVIGGQLRIGLARLDAATGLADSFDPNANNPSGIYSIAVQSDGKILAGGTFNTIGGQSRNLFARLLNDTAALSTLAVTQTTLTLTRNGSGAQFARVIFEQSIDNGATWTLLGTATNSFTSILGFNGGNASVNERVNYADTLPYGRVSVWKDENTLAPNAAGYTLGGQNIPTGQNVLIRARGFYRTGFNNGSETTEDKVQQVYLFPILAANVSVSGKVTNNNGNGIRNVIISLTDGNGTTRTARTSAFGYYNFEDVEAGQTYVITVQSKRFVFSPQVVQVNDNIADLDFTAQP